MGINKKICPIFTIQYGKFLGANRNGDKLILHVNVEVQTSNIINESGLNIVDIIKNQDGYKFKEIEYIGNLEDQDGIENKVISFTLDEEIICNIKEGNVIGSQVINNAINAWISPNI